MCTLVLDNDYPQAIPYPATMKPEHDMPTESDFHELLLKEHGTIFYNTQEERLQLENTLLTQVILSQSKYPHLILFHFADWVHK